MLLLRSFMTLCIENLAILFRLFTKCEYLEEGQSKKKLIKKKATTTAAIANTLEMEGKMNIIDLCTQSTPAVLVQLEILQVHLTLERTDGRER